MRPSQPRTVLHIYPSLGMGGAERLLLEAADRLPSSRWKLEVAVLHPGGALEEPAARRGIRVHPLSRGPGRWGELVTTARIGQLLRRRRPDLVHTHLYPAGKYGRLAAALHGIPSVHSLHGTPLVPQPRKEVAERWLSFFSGTILPVSDSVARWAVDEVGIPASRVRVLQNGVDLRRFDAHPPLPPPPEGRLIIGNVGRLHHDKGQDILLEAASIARRRRPNLEVWLVGDGPEEQALRRRADALNLTVRFWGNTFDVLSKLRRMHLFVLPSRREGFGLALLEAMACRLPCIATDLPPVRDAFGYPECAGRCFPVEDPAALAETMLALSRSPASARRLGIMARERARRFDMRSWATSLEHIYRTTLGLPVAREVSIAP